MKLAMPSTETLTVTIPQDIAERLDRVAKDTRATRSSLALVALVGWLEEEEANRAAILEGLEQARSGRSIPHQQVRAWLQSWGKENEQAPPACE